MAADIYFGEADLFAGNTEPFPWTAELYENNGIDRAELALADVVYCVLSERTGEEPYASVLEINSADATDEGSIVVIEELGDAELGEDASGYVRFAEGDTAAIVEAWDDAVRSKRYVCEMFYLDASESDPSNARKLICRGVVHLHRSAVIA